VQSIDKDVQSLAPLVEIVPERVTRGAPAPVVDTAVNKITQGLKRGRQRTPAAHCAKAIKKEKDNVPATGNPMQTLIFSEIAPQRNSNFFDWDHCYFDKLERFDY
jgi:hypothetical protein